MTQFEYMYVAQYMDRFEMESTHGYYVSISIEQVSYIYRYTMLYFWLLYFIF